jgi:hypothetical protein
MIECEFQQAMAAVNIQFRTNILPMSLHGSYADLQQVSDFLASTILSNQL